MRLGTYDSWEPQWVSISPCKRHGRIRLFCLPFAGGGSAFYHPWKEHLPADIELAKIQLPGRETRLREKAFTRMEMLVATLTEKLTPWLDRPFAFFGHSMGALITFELVRMIRTYNHAQPQHIFVSGYQAPHLPRSEKISHLPDAQFVQRLLEYGGIPKLVVENSELMEIFLPIFRADFEMIDNYIYQPGPPLDCPLTVFGGESDPKISREDLFQWKKHTTSDFSCHFLPGGHFFINESQPRLLDHLCNSLGRSM